MKKVKKVETKPRSSMLTEAEYFKACKASEKIFGRVNFSLYVAHLINNAK